MGGQEQALRRHDADLEMLHQSIASVKATIEYGRQLLAESRQSWPRSLTCWRAAPDHPPRSMHRYLHLIGR